MSGEIKLKFTVLWLAAIGLMTGLLWTGSVGAQALTSGADFLLMPVGARPEGMGQAYSAVADDLDALSFNPAGLAGIHEIQLGYSREEFLAGLNYDFLAAAAPVDGLGVLSLGYIGLGTAPFNSTSNPSAALVSYSDLAFLAAWGNSFYPFDDGSALQAGLSAKYISRNLAGIQGTGFAIDAGLRYVSRYGYTLSASLLNVGPGIQFSSLEPLPTVFEAGAAYKVLDEPKNSLTLAGELSWNLLSQTQQYSLGMEYWFQSLLAARAGYVFNSNVEGPTAGVGFKLDFIELDYAFQPENNLGTVNRFSVLFQFDGSAAKLAVPTVPQMVEAEPTANGFQVDWKSSDPQDQAFQVILQPIDGGPSHVSPAILASPYTYDDKGAHKLYTIQVRALGENGKISPLSPTVCVVSGVKKELELPTKEISAEVNKIGLNLSWDPFPGASGYNLYGMYPSGKVEKLSQAPKKSNRVLVYDTQGRQFSNYFVTAVNSDGTGETMIRSCSWDPSESEVKTLSKASTIKLQASLTHDQQIFLAWDAYPDIKAYSLYYSSQPDGVYEFYGDLTDPKPTVLLQMVTTEKQLHFLLGALSKDGKWVARSNDAAVAMVSEP